MDWTQISMIVGFAGVVLILLAFALNSFGIISNEALSYHIMNIVAATLLGTDMLTRAAWPGLTLQVAWGCIALIALVRVLRR